MKESIFVRIKNSISEWPTWKKVGMIIVGVQCILSIVAIITLSLLGILSGVWLAIAIILLLVFAILAYIVQQNKSTHIAGKIVSIILCLIILVADIGLIRVQSFLDKVDNNVKKTESKDVDVAIDPFIVYVSGNDEYGDLEFDGMTDVNILICVNPQSNQVLMISTPRDFYVEFPGYTEGERDKLSHSGYYGMEAQIKTLETLYECDINYYVWLNFTSFIEIVDAVGGITIENEQEFTSNDGFYFPAGTLELDGLHSLHYVRERNSFAGGDFARGKHQEEFIGLMIDKILKSNSLATYNNLLSAVEKNCSTNMPQNRIMELIKKQISDNPKWEITMAQAEGAIMAQACYTYKPQVLSVVMPYKQSVEYVRQMLRDFYAGKKVTALQMQPDDDYSYLTVPDPVDWNNYYDVEGFGADVINAIYGEVITTAAPETTPAPAETTPAPAEGGGEEPVNPNPDEPVPEPVEPVTDPATDAPVDTPNP